LLQAPHCFANWGPANIHDLSNARLNEAGARPKPTSNDLLAQLFIDLLIDRFLFLNG
jgi:hypothetical protein